ncbi:hypothetical protein FB45DRAFT_1064180, partial [Roridomyces roridus]
MIAARGQLGCALSHKLLRPWSTIPPTHHYTPLHDTTLSPLVVFENHAFYAPTSLRHDSQSIEQRTYNLCTYLLATTLLILILLFHELRACLYHLALLYGTRIDSG